MNQSDPTHFRQWEQSLSKRETALQTLDTETIRKKLELVKQRQNTASQKSKDWLSFRHNMITASDAHKCFGSVAAQNALIREKCQQSPLAQVTAVALEHGNLFEPVARRIYELLRNVTVEEFGCIQHPSHGFIGASPDGIVVSEESCFYGRLVEIKVPKSRILTPHAFYIPVAYRDQMQIQMETLDLPFCDYFECKLEVFESQEEYENPHIFLPDTSIEQKGLLIQLEDGVSHIYVDQVTEPSSFVMWKNAILDTPGLAPINRVCFWRLEQHFLCVVQRDESWFNDFALPKLVSTWRKIEEARQDPSLQVAVTSRKKPQIQKQFVVDTQQFPHDM